MCNPMFAMGVMAVGGVMNATSAEASANAQNKAIEYNARLMEKNQELANKEADFIESQTATEESNIRKRVLQFKDSQKAAFISGGVLSNSGSAQDVQDQTQTYGDLDAMTTKLNIKKQAFNVRMQANQYGQQANISRMGKQDPNLAFMTSLLGSGSQIGSMYAMKG